MHKYVHKTPASSDFYVISKEKHFMNIKILRGSYSALVVGKNWKCFCMS